MTVLFCGPFNLGNFVGKKTNAFAGAGPLRFIDCEWPHHVDTERSDFLPQGHSCMKDDGLHGSSGWEEADGTFSRCV